MSQLSFFQLCPPNLKNTVCLETIIAKRILYDGKEFNKAVKRNGHHPDTWSAIKGISLSFDKAIKKEWSLSRSDE